MTMLGDALNFPTAARYRVAGSQIAASNLFLCSALAHAVPARAALFIVRRSPQYNQKAEFLSRQIAKCSHRRASLAPEVVESGGGQFGILHGVPDRTVPKPALDRSGIVPC